MAIVGSDSITVFCYERNEICKPLADYSSIKRTSVSVRKNATIAFFSCSLSPNGVSSPSVSPPRL